MHYYKFNIGDWILHTAHLSPQEEGIYLRLLNHYYDTEGPIPEETQSVIRRLRLTGFEEDVLAILDEYFQLNDGFWTHKRCEKEVLAYQAKTDTNRENGKKGGRPRGSGHSQKTDEKPTITQSVNYWNPKETLTKNDKPLTKNQIEKDKKSNDDFLLAEFMSKRINLIAPINPNLKTWAKNIRLMRERDGRTHQEICQVFVWANQDDFWRTNILSPAKLRKQYGQLFAKMNQEVSRETYQESGGNRKLSTVDRVRLIAEERERERIPQTGTAEPSEAYGSAMDSPGGDLWAPAQHPLRDDDSEGMGGPAEGVLVN